MRIFSFVLESEPLKTDLAYLGSYVAVKKFLECAEGVLQKEDIEGFFKFLGIKSVRQIAEELGITRQAYTRWLTSDVLNMNKKQHQRMTDLVERVESNAFLFSRVDAATIEKFADIATSLEMMSMKLTVRDLLKYLLAEFEK